MNILARQFLLAGISYDEKNNRKKAESLFGEFRYYRDFRSSRDFMAVSVTWNGVLDITLRGTDGDGIIEQMQAWLRNADWRPDETGCHPGFRESAQWCYDRIEDIMAELPPFTRCYVNGHSGGSGIGPQLGLMLAAQLSPVAIHCLSFASPPTFNEFGAKRFEDAHAKCGLSNTYIINPRDIVTQVCRRIGRDVGTRFELPPDSTFQRIFKKVWSVHEHRCREYCDGLIIASKGNPETVDLLKRGRKLLVN